MKRHHASGPCPREAGLTLLEAVFGLAILTSGLLFVGAALQSANQTASAIEEDLRVLSKAQDIADLCVLQPFGDDADPTPTAVQLDELFNDDDVPGDITLNQLSRWPVADDGWTFSLAGFPVPGAWRVKVDNDVSDTRPPPTGNLVLDAADVAKLTAIKNAKSIYAIRVYFNDELILMTLRRRG